MHTLIHLSDTHILPTEDDRLHGVDTFTNLAQVFQQIAVSGVQPDAVILSGDIANGGEPESYRRARQLLDEWQARLEARMIVAMGNHDARAPFREGLLGIKASDEPVEYVEWLDGLRVLILDSTVPGAPYGEVRPQQLAWLESELNTPAPDGTVVVLHHPPVPDPTRLAGLLTLHGSDDLADVVSGSDVVAVLAGHAHHAISASFGGVLCYAAPATAYTVDPLVLGQLTLRGVQGGGFGVLRVFDHQAVALTVPTPGSGEETYRMQLSEEVLRRWSGDSAVAATA